MFNGRGTDEGPVSREQFIFLYTLALLNGWSAAGPAYGDEADSICRAAGICTAAVTVTLEGWRRKEAEKKELLQHDPIKGQNV